MLPDHELYFDCELAEALESLGHGIKLVWIPCGNREGGRRCASQVQETYWLEDIDWTEPCACGLVKGRQTS